jgi:tyrosinase
MISAVCTRLSIVPFVLAIALLGEASAQVPQRKNIDLLTPQELAAYEHAIQILMDRSAANPFDKSGYRWQAWVHNCEFIRQPASGTGAHDENCDSVATAPDPNFVAAHPGVCEHGKDLFLIWHRAQFYYFEKILQGTDPDGKTGPSTKNVTVPFWNWTRKPTGIRYPKAFEKEGSPLNYAKGNRNREALTPDEQVSLKQVTSPEAVAALVYNRDWSQFGGHPQESATGGSGGFEGAHHNPMHGSYVGGDMADSSRAALDPIFFSYHSYIDLVLQWWLDEHGSQSMTSLNNFMRASQPDNITPVPGHTQGAGLPSMGQAKLYLDLSKLGYGYEVTAEDRLPSRDAVIAASSVDGARAVFGSTEKSTRARLAGNGLFDPRTGPPTMISKIAVRIPDDIGAARATFSRPHDATDVTFAVDFYLHPARLELDLAAKVDREKYIVTTQGHFGTGLDRAHSGHSQAKPVFADLRRPLRDLIKTGHAGENWTLTAVVSGQAPAPAFGTLSLAQ